MFSSGSDIEPAMGFIGKIKITLIDARRLMQEYASDSIQHKYSVYFHYKGELAVDTGGASRDVFATFWGKAYEHMFDGVGTVVPLVMPQTDISQFSHLGVINETFRSGCREPVDLSSYVQWKVIISFSPLAGGRKGACLAAKNIEKVHVSNR